MTVRLPLAHSAPRHDPGRPQPYAEHVRNVCDGARCNGEAMLRYAPASHRAAVGSLLAAAEYHDLGKLAERNQQALRAGRAERLVVDHIDAGVAHALARGDTLAAWLIRAHHFPGLPSEPEEEVNRRRRGGRNPPPPPLRGGRRREWDSARCVEHATIVQRTDRELDSYLETHRSVVSPSVDPTASAPIHGLTMRLLLGCLVDADHADSARHDTLRDLPPRPPPRWAERIESLDHHVSTLPRGDAARSRQRAALYDACRTASHDAPIVSCRATVGSGKTFALVRHLLATAHARGLRRIVVVAPFTTIISQTVARLRAALVLPGEDPTRIVAEHHHKVEHSSIETRELATLWRAPIVVTTAVQFFETLASNEPSALRKLHELPGSGVFVDEAHATMRIDLWTQAWEWLLELAESWSCRFVLASGSLVELWRDARVVELPTEIPELTPSDLLATSHQQERARIQVAKLTDRAVTLSQLVDRVVVLAATAGSVLVILNTVQSAAVVARAAQERFGEAGQGRLQERRVLHLSTALCPGDRERILAEVDRRFAAEANGQGPWQSRGGWVLVATSCVEAGVELDFGVGIRERCSVASFIQTGGRVNRHARRTAGPLFDFTLAMDDPLLTEHPAFARSREVFAKLWPRLEAMESATELASLAVSLELDSKGGGCIQSNALRAAELQRRYPDVEDAGRLIVEDTCTVIVDQELVRRFETGDRPSAHELQRGSVQLWGDRSDRLGLVPLSQSGRGGRAELYAWPPDFPYEPDFLGVMATLLQGSPSRII